MDNIKKAVTNRCDFVICSLQIFHYCYKRLNKSKNICIILIFCVFLQTIMKESTMEKEKTIVNVTDSTDKKKKTRKRYYVSKSRIGYIHPSLLKRISINPTLRGFDSLGDILGSNFVFTDFIDSSDREALIRDWMAVGNDLKVSIGKIMK